MRSRQYVTPGIVHNIAKPNSDTVGFDLTRWFKKELDFLKVTFFDECCDGDKLELPVRYNSDDEVLQYFDGEDWVSVPDDLALDGDIDVDGSVTADSIITDTISEETAATGVTIDGVLLKDSQVTTDQINEKTAATGVTVDGVLLKDGGVGSGAMFAGFYPVTAQQALSGAGAINVTAFHTAWTTTGANAGTLANGTVIGQRKKITMVVDGGDGTLTPTSLSGGTTITFNDAGDYVDLIWNGTAWVVIVNSGTTIA